LLPMISGALCGLAVVAAGFGVIHGITLGFGVTLIGEAVDYAIYLFVQRARRVASTCVDASAKANAGARASGFWATIALGVATSVIGFAALIFSGFQGLAQIGILSIVGLVVAASVTRWVLPALMPAGFTVRAMPRLGRALARSSARASILQWPVLALAIGACIVLFVHRDRLWSDDLAALSPVAQSDQATDRRLRSELGAPDVRDLVIVVAPDQESALAGSERVVAALAPLIADGSLVGVDAPSRYLPSSATQRARQAALPDDTTLRANFAKALEGLPFSRARFDEFFDDAAREKNGPLITRADLEGTSLATGTRALLSHQEGSRQWTALVALRSPAALGGTSDAPRARIAQALTPLRQDRGVDPTVEVRAIDIKTETQQLYVGYLSEAVRAAGFGALAIIALLAFVLRDVRRLVRVLVPLALAVVLVAAAQVVIAGPLTLFHLVGLLLIVAVGSNYALFFDRRTRIDRSLEAVAMPVEDADKTADKDDAGDDAADAVSDDRALLTSLVIANLTAVIGFGVLGFSSLPVLHAIGTTVAPGALLALLLSAVFAATRARPNAATVALP
ncbi:MAG: MMPL family transporter, partial [Burkholderiaceae bacterium]